MGETEPGERRAAGTERGTGLGTGLGTERDTGPDTGPGTQPDSEPGTQPGTAEGPQRPPYSYVALITMAIRASPEQRLPLSSIYAYIAERFPFYRGPCRRWQNSVRHNLSLNPCFRRLPGRHGRAGHWALHPAFQDMFPGGDYHLRRRRRLRSCRPSASPPPPAGTPPDPAAPRPLLLLQPRSGPATPGVAPGVSPPPGVLPDPAVPRPLLLLQPRPGPAAPWPPVPGSVPPVPPGCPAGPWAALVLPRGYPQLPARGPPVPPGQPLPAWPLLPAGPDTAATGEPGPGMCPSFR